MSDDRSTLQSKSGSAVNARFLTDFVGNVIYGAYFDQNGNRTDAPAFVPNSMPDLTSFAKGVQSSWHDMLGFAPNGPFDIQRSYDGNYLGVAVGAYYKYSGNKEAYNANFVSEFTPSASITYGYSAPLWAIHWIKL